MWKKKKLEGNGEQFSNPKNFISLPPHFPPPSPSRSLFPRLYSSATRLHISNGEKNNEFGERAFGPWKVVEEGNSARPGNPLSIRRQNNHFSRFLTFDALPEISPAREFFFSFFFHSSSSAFSAGEFTTFSNSFNPMTFYFEGRFFRALSYILWHFLSFYWN